MVIIFSLIENTKIFPSTYYNKETVYVYYPKKGSY